jgi:hypothetical protein
MGSEVRQSALRDLPGQFDLGLVGLEVECLDLDDARAIRRSGGDVDRQRDICGFVDIAFQRGAAEKKIGELELPLGQQRVGTAVGLEIDRAAQDAIQIDRLSGGFHE